MRMLCLCRLALCVLFPFTSADVLAEEFKFKRPSTTVQLPEFGVSIDAEGVLDLKVTRDPGGALFAQRIAAARAKLPPDIQRPTNLRKISLSRLDQALGRQAANGQRAEEAMQNLAGLLQIEYVFCYPDSNDIVIAGPAEGWVPDGIGRNVGITSGRPTLRLDDLAVALRQYPPGQRNQQFIGCTISPTKTGLEALAEFQKTIPRTVSSRQRGAVAAYTAKGMRDALGLADIRTWGVPPESNFAQVMVEADYRMKLIAIGIEPPPIKLASYLDLIRTPREGALERFWFTPNYECVKVTDDRLAMQLVGQGVQLQTEHKIIGPGGVLLNAARNNPASERFCAGFTTKYEELSAASGVYAQFRTLIDLVIAAAYVQREDLYRKSGFSPQALLEEKIVPVETCQPPKKVQAAVNVLWRGSRMIAPAGGGVSINAHLALEEDRLLADEDGQLDEQHESSSNLPAGRWWWD